MASNQERYDKALNKLKAATSARLRWERQEYDKAVAESKERQARYDQMLEEASKGPSWKDRLVGGITGGLTGAGMGMMATGTPMGALAGAGIGGTAGALAPRQTPAMMASAVPLASALQNQRMSLAPAQTPGSTAVPNSLYGKIRATTGAKFSPSISGVPSTMPTASGSRGITTSKTGPGYRPMPPLPSLTEQYNIPTERGNLYEDPMAALHRRLYIG